MSLSRFRPIFTSDVPALLSLWPPDQGLISPEIWRELGRNLPWLLGTGRVRGALVEQLASGQLDWFTFSAFAPPALLECDGRPLVERLLGGRQCLAPSQIAAHNACGDLHLVSLCAGSRGLDFHPPLLDAWSFVNSGYRLAGFWRESANSEERARLHALGMQTVRQRESTGLLRYTREDAVARPAAYLSYFFHFPQPQLGFTRWQQELLELAVLDLTDREVAHRLSLGGETIKKRWHALYARVRRRAPALMQTEGAGPDQRRRLLGYLRQHPEELRPYRASNFPSRGKLLTDAIAGDQNAKSVVNLSCDE